MLIYLGAIAILFVFGVMLVHNNKKVVVKTEKGAIPFLFSISVLFLFTALEAVASVSELVKGLDPNQSSELLNVGFNMYHYLGNSLFISFLMLCVPMIAIMLFVEE
jgi:NADH:ubiquinone oxidoreductase subunit 6 (subunit J)